MMTIDEVGRFWVVTAPGAESVLEDILFQSTVTGMELQFKGGLDSRDILGLFKDGGRAREFAVERLWTRPESETGS